MTAEFFKLNQKGYTLIEMAIATLLMGVMATTVILANRFVNVQTVQNSDRTFATEKAIQMYEELRALVNGNEKGIAILDNYNQFVLDNVLTTDKSVDVTIGGNPGDPLSGNIKTDGHWRYSRIITVAPVANDTQGRRVSVKVFLYPGDNAPQTMTGTLLATVGGILRTSILPFEPTQVLDVYILQIGNIPSWWSVLPTLAADMDNAIADLQSRLTGLQIRAHYITRTSYGRDSLYQPEINSSASAAESIHQSWVYFYPGYTEQDSGGDGWYYDGNTSDQKNSVFLTGNFMEDGTSSPVSTTQFGGANISYSVADQYNNAMRYPDELAAFQAVTAAAAAAGQVNLGPVTEISERMLLEGMLSQPASFQNAIIVNLHGELLPLPPLRNYSDAAKDPANQLSLDTAPMTCAIAASNGVSGNTNVRVVTHPELLYYPVSISGATTATAVTVRLRVYAYYDSEDVGGSAGLPTGDPRVPYISLFLPDASATVVGVTVNIGSSSVTYGKVGITTGLPNTPGSTWTSGNVPGDTGGPMNMSVSYVGPGKNQTLITLANTPLRAPINTGGVGGLNTSDMLYGAEYIPCSPDQTSGTSNTNYYNNSYNFGNDLGNDAVTAANNPKNTARWIISLAIPVTQNYPGPVTIGIWSGGLTTTASGVTFTQAGTHAIETRLGNGVTSSVVTIGASPATIYPNLSRTYVWCGSTIPPYTEQYQFMGDPRDCPYYDVKVGGISVTGAGITIGPNAYNWWFKGTVNEATSMTADGYAGFGQGAVSQWNGNGGGNIQVDLPRYYQLIRQGLLATTSIWTGTNGWSWFYYGVGGEYGSDQGPRSNGIIMYDDLFKNTSGGSVVADFNAIYPGDGKDGSHGYGLFVASNTTGSNSVTWYQRSWLGELYPDKSYLQEWVTYGNLPSIAHSGTPPESFYLEPMHKVNFVSANSSLDGFAGVTFWVCPAGYGSESFYDGKNTTTGGRFEHNSADANGTELNLAVTTYNIFPFPLPGVMDVNREWDLGGGNPPEAGIAPYNSAGMTTTIDIPTVTSTSLGTVSRLFYNYGSATTQYGSGVMRMTQKNAGVTQVGYVVESGYAPSTGVGPDILAETALVFGMRTFLDGGLMAVTNAAGHIPQLPLVRIYFADPVPVYNASQTITFTVGCPVTATSAGGGAVSVGMPVTDIWWGFNPNGLANFYTEEYPYNNGSVTSAAMTGTGFYQESGVTVVYNLKYNNGSAWYNVSDNSAAVTGVYDSTHSYNPPTYVAPWTYNWLVASGGTTLPQASYELMVEAYRQGYGLHYSYDIQKFQVSW
jgi:prepilin-type N-terminal cleavage/methylation domain-containing protein